MNKVKFRTNIIDMLRPSHILIKINAKIFSLLAVRDVCVIDSESRSLLLRVNNIAWV